ncbi:MAG: FAD:protein FMN transferase [Candidatus Nanoarchaeia archaeon]
MNNSSAFGKTLMALAAIAVCLFWIFILQRNSLINHIEPPKLVMSFPVMGTIAEIQFYGDEKRTQKAADIVKKKFDEIEKTFSIFDPASELAKLNSNAFNTPFQCSEQLWELINKARFFHKISDGAFDISCAPLMELWGFYRKQGQLPKKSEVESTLQRVGLDKIIFDDKNHSVQFTVPGMRLDFGGVAKGYAVDLATEAAKAAGIKAGIINLGGNLKCLEEPPPKKKAYTIGIRDPFNKNSVCGTVELLNKSCSTSGNYEKYVNIEGKRFTHIMNPSTGMPVENSISVTVITESACDADALSTSFFIQGEKILNKVLEHYPSIQILMITETQENPLEITNENISKDSERQKNTDTNVEKETATLPQSPYPIKIKKIGILWPEKLFFCEQNLGLENSY